MQDSNEMEKLVPLSDLFKFIDNEYQMSFVAAPLFNEGINLAPIEMRRAEVTTRAARSSVFSDFFDRVNMIFWECLTNAAAKPQVNYFLNDSVSWRERDFYTACKGVILQAPDFFRTDESADGRVLEIQCPGSGWGDVPLLKNLYREFGIGPILNYTDICTQTAKDIEAITGEPECAISHFLDAASNPASMRYFFSQTQPPLRYWGYHSAVGYSESKYIRSHSVRSLFAENLFETRIRQALDGNVHFDLPPNPIFDQKLLVCLPFDSEFRNRFSEEIRDLFVYSTVATPEGFRDVDGEFITWAAFSSRSSRNRRYFLKYGGCDTNFNWGSRAVFRLDGTEADLRKRIYRATEEISKGRIWIVQPEAARKERVRAAFRSADKIRSETMTAKYSSFYGPSGLLGVRTMHSNHFKVHGQPSTVIGLPGISNEY